MTNSPITTTYVAYQHPGIINSSESVVPVDARDPQQQANAAPDSAFAFFYFDIITSIVDVGGELVEVSSDRRNISTTYYIDARVLNYDEVRALEGDSTILLSNMQVNGWTSVILCRTGNFQPFRPEHQQMVTTS